jgi:hypothetical protein
VDQGGVTEEVVQASRPRSARFFRSILGALLALLTIGAFVAAYAAYRAHAGEWFADAPVSLISMPYSLAVRQFGDADFEVFGADAGQVIAAAAFCAVLAYLIGATVETLLRGAFRLVFRR